MIKRDREQLEYWIRKPYRQILAEEIISLYDEVDELNAKIAKFEAENTSLKSLIESPKYKMAESIANYVESIVLNQSDIQDIVKSEVNDRINNLDIEVEGYYDSYSGQREHYHRVIINNKD